MFTFLVCMKRTPEGVGAGLTLTGTLALGIYNERYLMQVNVLPYFRV